MSTVRIDQILESHENRILRIESSSPELSVQVARFMSQQEQLSDKMDALMATMQDHATKSASKLEKIDIRVAHLEETDRRSKWLLEWGKKIIWPAVIVIGAILAKFGERVADWWSR